LYDVIVVGLGGMGSAALYHLARRGSRVLGIDQFRPPHAMGSSHGGSRIIRLAYYEHASYVPLLRRSYELWRELEREAGEDLLRITGSLDVSVRGGTIVEGSLASCEAHGIPHEVLTASEIARRFPAWRLPADFAAVYQPDGGILAPERCVAAHLRLAAAAGATLQLEDEVLWIEMTREALLVRTARGEHRTSRVVIAAGPWTAKLLPQFRALAVPERQVVGWFTPLEARLFERDFPVYNIGVEEGHYYGFPSDDDGVKVGRYHHLGETVDASGYDRGVHEHDEHALRPFITRYLPAADGRMVKGETCLFTNSPDEHFIIDAVPGLPGAVVAAGFSGHGFKFCSVVGEILAELADDGTTRHDIAFLRLGRFAAEETSV
jgi:sarcosine oxidase